LYPPFELPPLTLANVIKSEL